MPHQAHGRQMLNRIESRSRRGSGGRDIGETDAMGLHIHVAVVDHDPGTGGPLADAPAGLGETVTRRICDVVGQKTEFGVPTAVDPVAVRLAVGRVAFEPGGTAESLLARAREAPK
jgi:hypothetical protein